MPLLTLIQQRRKDSMAQNPLPAMKLELQSAPPRPGSQTSHRHKDRDKDKDKIILSDDRLPLGSLQARNNELRGAT